MACDTVVDYFVVVCCFVWVLDWADSLLFIVEIGGLGFNVCCCVV